MIILIFYFLIQNKIEIVKTTHKKVVNESNQKNKNKNNLDSFDKLILDPNNSSSKESDKNMKELYDFVFNESQILPAQENLSNFYKNTDVTPACPTNVPEVKCPSSMELADKNQEKIGGIVNFPQSCLNDIQTNFDNKDLKLNNKDIMGFDSFNTEYANL